MARLAQIVIDCTAPATLARVWAAALDGFEIRSYDRQEVERLARLGYTPETDPTVLVDGPALEICFQQVAGLSPGKRRLHLDLAASDRAGEVLRLVELGATIREQFETHTWMTDLEGNDFCVTDC